MRGFWARHRPIAYLAAYLALLLGIALLVPYWRDLDMFLFGFLNRGTAPSLSSEIVAVHVPYLDAEDAYRDQISALLQTLSATGQHPSAVILDVYFTHGHPESAQRLAAAMAQLRAVSPATKVYAVVNPLDESGIIDPGYRAHHDATLYDAALDGAGHTLMESKFATLWYESRLSLTRQLSVPALPVQIAVDFSREVRTPVARPTVIDIGPTENFQSVLYAFAKTGPATGVFQEYARPAAATGPGRTPDFQQKFLIVGSVREDIPPYPWNRRSGPELLAWALSDHLVSDRRRGVLWASGGLLATLTVAFSALAAYTFLRLFDRFKTKQNRLWVLYICAVGSSLALYATLVLVLRTQHQILPQATLVVLGVLGAAALSWHYVSRLIWASLFDPHAPDLASPQNQYDIFISYSHDPQVLQWVKTALYEPLASAHRKDGSAVRVFFDKSGIEGGMFWFRKLGLSIQASRLFLPVYSEDYFSRNFCCWEMDVAAVKRVKQDSFVVLPVLRGARDIPSMYQMLQYLEAGDTQLIPKILQQLG